MVVVVVIITISAFFLYSYRKDGFKYHDDWCHYVYRGVEDSDDDDYAGHNDADDRAGASCASPVCRKPPKEPNLALCTLWQGRKPERRAICVKMPGFVQRRSVPVVN